MHVVKPLYGIAEAGTHWWATYSKHHHDKLNMKSSSFDPCLLITEDHSWTTFGLVGMQTDDTLILCNDAFSKLEEEQIQIAQIAAKTKQKLDPESELIFNGCRIRKSDHQIHVQEKGQGLKLQLVNTSENDPKQRYVEQRARGAYIASICQPEAIFDLSTAAQHQNPVKSDIDALNKRIQWQIDNPDRGLRYIPFNIRKCSLFVFMDRSFANNKDISSQLSFLIIIRTKSREKNSFKLVGNIIHYSLTKSKRVIRSILVSKIYRIVLEVDIAYVFNIILN